MHGRGWFKLFLNVFCLEIIQKSWTSVEITFDFFVQSTRWIEVFKRGLSHYLSIVKLFFIIKFQIFCFSFPTYFKWCEKPVLKRLLKVKKTNFSFHFISFLLSFSYFCIHFLWGNCWFQKHIISSIGVA